MIEWKIARDKGAYKPKVNNYFIINEDHFSLTVWKLPTLS